MGNAIGRLHFHSVSQLTIATGLATVLTTTAVTSARAYDVNDKLSVNGVAAGTVQCQDLSQSAGDLDTCGSAGVFQPEITFNGGGANTGFVKLGFAGGNGLNPDSPFALSPWAADLQADLQNINARPRDHVLTAWYRHRFNFGGNAQLGLTGGLIDATDYLDDNAFANDEYTQFMNEVFVNAPTAGLPSYDWGGVAELDHGPWSARAVVMSVGENDDGNGYNFYGGQVAFTTTTALGEGTYRLIVAQTDDRFLNPAGAVLEKLSSLTFSADQRLGEAVGVFARLGWQDDAAAVTHDAFYSGGVNVSGKLWARNDDTIGIGYAHLEGGNGDVRSSHVAEFYYRLVINKHLALTGDVQLLRDKVAGGGGPKGAIVGLRTTKEF